jgi:hypothetical protein
VQKQRTWVSELISAAARPMTVIFAGTAIVGSALANDSPAAITAPMTTARIPISLTRPQPDFSRLVQSNKRLVDALWRRIDAVQHPRGASIPVE